MKKTRCFILFSLLGSALMVAGTAAQSIFAIYGEGEETVFLDENYTNSNITVSKCYSYNHVANGGGSSHGVVPGEKWGDPINASNGDIVYKVNANEGKAFDTLKLNFNYLARTDLVMKDDTKTNQASFKVYFSLSPDDFKDPVQTFAGWTNSSVFKDGEVDFSLLAEGETSVYVKIELCHNTGSVSLSNTGTKLKTVKFSGTEKESTTAYVTKSDTYTTTQAAKCVFDSFSNLGGFGNSNGLVPTKKWGADVDTCKDAYVIYSIVTPVGPTFTSININVSGRAWNGGSGTKDGQTVSTNGSKINLYLSQDASDFGNPVKTLENTTANPSNLNYTDYVICNDATTMYVKIELIHPEMKVGLSNVGCRLYSATISGGYDITKIIDSTPLDKTIVLGDTYKSYESKGILKTFESSGKTYIYCGENKAHIIIPISCDSLYKFYNITYSQLVRCTTYNGAATIFNALTFSVSLDGNDFTKVQSIDTDTNWTRQNVTLNLSSYLRGAHKAFVKVEFDWSGKDYSHDWIALSDIHLTGDLLNRNEYDIYYENLFNGTNNPSNPLTYTYGSTITLLPPTRTNYDFAGWYLDELYITPFTGITPTTKGDITVYAKWDANYIPVTLNAGEGTFQNGTNTKIAEGNYNLPLYRSDLEIPQAANADFIDWFKDPTFTARFIFADDYGEPDLITESTTIYAKFGNSAIVTYKYNDDITSDVKFYQEVGEVAKTVSEPAYQGFKFGGWYDGSKKYDFTTTLIDDVTLTAKWYKIYNISYEGVEGATHANPTTYTIDQANIQLADPVMPGFTFEGWYLDGAKVTYIDASLAKDLVLTAIWSANKYNLTIQKDEHVTLDETPTKITFLGVVLKLNVENGYRVKSVTANNVNVPVEIDHTVYVAGFACDVTINIETTPSYFYNGSIDVEFKNETNIGEHVADMNNVRVYTDNQSSSRFGWLVPEDYSRPGYITYAIDAGEGQTINSLNLSGKARVFTYQGSAAVLDVYFSSNGQDFELMNSYSSTTDGEANTEISINLTSKVKNTRIAYIKYVIESGNHDWVSLESIHANMSFTCVSVKFMDGNKTIYTNNDQIKGGKITLLENPTKKGYTFMGWYADEKFRNKIDSNYIVEEDMIVYAKWEAQTFNVTYNLPEGADIGDNVESFTADEEIELTEAYLKNHKFVGWFDNADFSGDPITKISKGTTNDVVLFGKFEKGIAINYQLNGGTNSELNPEVYFMNEETVLFDPFREGYVFGGWYLDPEFKDSISIIEGGDGDPITIYAMWIEDGKDEPKKGGCGGSVAGASIITLASAGVGFAILSMKKHKEK